MYDLIERQAAIDAVGDVHPLDYNGQAILERIKALPTAEKVGKWIKYKDRTCWYCSECTTDDYYAYTWDCDTDEYKLQDNYCPHCGARMRGEEG